MTKEWRWNRYFTPILSMSKRQGGLRSLYRPYNSITSLVSYVMPPNRESMTIVIRPVMRQIRGPVREVMTCCESCYAPGRRRHNSLTMCHITVTGSGMERRNKTHNLL